MAVPVAHHVLLVAVILKIINMIAAKPRIIFRKKIFNEKSFNN